MSIFTSTIRIPAATAAAIAALLLGGCSKDSENLPGDDATATAQITAHVSEMALSRASGTQWDAGDCIGITTLPPPGVLAVTNIQYTTTAGDGTFVPVDAPGEDNSIGFIGQDEYTFTAYYPYTGANRALPGANGTITRRMLLAEDFAPEAQAGWDYLWGTATASASSPQADITFHHCMSRLLLHFVEGDGVTFPAGGLKIRLDNIFLEGEFDIQTGKAEATDNFLGGVDDISVPQSRTGSYILWPQNNPAQTLYVTIEGRVFSASLFPPKGKLEAGKTYEYTVTVKRHGLDVKAETGDVPWQDGILTTTIDGKEFRLIRTAEDLARFARDVNGGEYNLNALQVADIDLQELAGSEDDALRALAADWGPIGGYGTSYTGIYCGNGYTISGLHITTNHNYNGFFGSVTGNGALLTGIHLRDVEITGPTGPKTGALAGYIQNGTATLCSAKGKIEVSLPTGGDSGGVVGGLVGHAANCSINRCHTNVDIRAEVTLQGNGSARAGGIVGQNICLSTTSTLFVCQADGDVSLTGTGTSTAAQPLCTGGIAGYNSSHSNSESAAILACVATGNITATYTGTDAVNAWAGGLVGYHGEMGELWYSYARGTATATVKDNTEGAVGAIVGGYAPGSGNSTIVYCFGAGAGGKGTSGLEESGNIVYNTTPGEGEIKNIAGRSWPKEGISTTDYNVSATPAYGISVNEREFNILNLWKDGDGVWPVLDMENNGN